MTALSPLPQTVREDRQTHGYRASPIEGGVIQTAAKHQRVGRRWRLGWPAVTDTERLALEALFDTTKGGSLSLTWTPPDETTQRNIRILGSLRVLRRSGKTASVKMLVEERL